MHRVLWLHLGIWVACLSACGGMSEGTGASGCREWLKQYEAAQRAAEGNCAAGFARSCPECVTASGSICKTDGVCG